MFNKTMGITVINFLTRVHNLKVDRKYNFDVSM